MSYKTLWQGRTDTEDGVRGQRWHQVVNVAPTDSQRDTIALIGYPVDQGVVLNKGRPGAGGGPNALRQSLSSLPWVIEGSLSDHGDISPQSTLPQTQQRYSDSVTELLSHHQCVLGLGGGHDIARGSFHGLQQFTGKQARIGIINFDAHLDLRKPAPHSSSGTPFRDISEWCKNNSRTFNYCCMGVSVAANTPALFDYARQTDTLWLEDIDFDLNTATSVLPTFLSRIDTLYVTVCMDAFPASAAPGVSAPAAVGIDAATVINLIRWLGRYCRQHTITWSLSDIAELSPFFDKENKTARLAARIAFELTRAMTK
ncbi:formimidoylglutamase [Salinimonas sp. HHU 13199]|uniref:Formimidoylglutamase n=1 Tax=Salinimonas profundi TaxID=2729140 RepID=A0ABR8LE59_9ALTE|nr:formimidoylglutamase [Salinimonas profundi]MBD3584579.1 formimidoylglutamase [Salinimonas profundi]